MEAVKLGVRGIVLKESSPEVLLECVRRVHRGEQWIERETVTRALQRVLERETAAREAGETLTPREIEIVRMVAQDCATRSSPIGSPSPKAPSRCIFTTSTKNSASTGGWNWCSALSEGLI
jgi:hypothetical protein